MFNQISRIRILYGWYPVKSSPCFTNVYVDITFYLKKKNKTKKCPDLLYLLLMIVLFMSIDGILLNKLAWKEPTVVVLKDIRNLTKRETTDLFFLN